jgi:hypothetical protein
VRNVILLPFRQSAPYTATIQRHQHSSSHGIQPVQHTSLNRTANRARAHSIAPPIPICRTIARPHIPDINAGSHFAGAGIVAVRRELLERATGGRDPEGLEAAEERAAVVVDVAVAGGGAAVLVGEEVDDDGVGHGRGGEEGEEGHFELHVEKIGVGWFGWLVWNEVVVGMC